MQNDRYSSSRQPTYCNWCCTHYVVGQSRARENTIFCTKRCEIEARFWLNAVLQSVQQIRKNDAAL